MKKLKIAAFGDSPRQHTGFGNVMAQILMGFHEAGHDVHVYAFLDHEPDEKNEIPYNFFPTPHLDDLGHRTFSFFLRKIKPDIIFILTDPGNISMYLHGMIYKKASWFKREDDEWYVPPVVAYTPIEGWPVPEPHIEAFEMIKMLNGSLVVYCQSAREKILRKSPDLDLPIHVVNHGHDHADFRAYSLGDRQMLRELIGWDNKFVIGSIGVNKRTKGFPYLIYAAQILREMGEDEDILFYCHTNPKQGTMYGYSLEEMTRDYGVDDMFVWKQAITNVDYWRGAARDTGTVEQARKIAGKVPDTPQGRGLLFKMYDFISIINCFDLYLDSSQNEGWGLPLGEAMCCGIPAISIRDSHVREEVFEDGPYFIDPLPPHLWETWHTGSRLVTIDPVKIVRAILEMRDNCQLREEVAQRGKKIADKYVWEPVKKKMTAILEETYRKDQHDIKVALEEIRKAKERDEASD